MLIDEKLEIVLKTIGNCQIIDTIGRSKLGVTYLVEHNNLGKCVLKLLKEDIFVTRKFFKSLKRYSEIINEISYPGIAKVYKISEEPFPYLFREYSSGISLEEQIQEGLSPLEATSWIEKLTLALQAAYNFGISHKNLKPTNIFLDNANGTLQVVDFCLPASLSFYLSPEHCNNVKRDYRSDIYALGIIFYQSLTGEVPFQGKFREVKKMHLESEWPQIPEIPKEIENILVKTSAKNPEERYPTLLTLLGDLRNAKKLFTDKHKGIKTKITFAMPKIQRFVDEVEDPESPIAEDNEVSILEEDTLYNYPAKNLDANKEYHIADSLPIIDLEDFDSLDFEEQEDFIKGITPQDITLPDAVSKTLKSITDTRDIIRNKKILNNLSLNFPKKYSDIIVDYLAQVIRRECWSIKNTSDPETLQLVIDLADAKTYRYYNYFDDQIRTALKKLPQTASINKTFFTQEGASSPGTQSKSKSHASFFSILDTIISVKDNEVEVYDEESENESYQKKAVPEEVQENVPGDNWLNVDEKIGENIRKLSHDENDLKDPKELDEPKDIATQIELNVNLGNRYQARAWFKMIKENALEKGKHFILKENKSLKKSCFLINLTELHEYQKQQQGLSSVKAFFQADYNIERLDHGGMATVLKLITKNDITIIFLRPENHWAREYFAENLRIRKTKDGKEGVYAEMPKDAVVVVKVAFEGREEALIYESRLLSKLAEAKNIRKYIIGMIQEGSFLAASADSQITEERVGYYLMLEYASLGNIEQFSKNFPFHQLTPSIAFNVLYSMVTTLQFLKSQGIIHRDIKPQNILMSSNMIAKLGDFGLAITVDEAGSKLNDERRRLLKLVDQEFLHISSEKEQCESRLLRLQTSLKKLSYPDDFQKFEQISTQITTLKTQLENLVSQELERADDLKKRYRPMSAEEIAIKGEFAGSMIYAAPEQFSPSKILTCDCDIYQLGAVAYTMLTGKLPVQGKNISAIMSEIILSHKPRVSDEIKDSPVVEALSDIIYDMMINDIAKRISVDEIRKQLEKILLNFYPDLLKTPYFHAPKNMEIEEKEKWQEQVLFAQNAHQQNAQYLTEWYEQLKEEELLIEKQKQEKEDAEIINLWWEGNKIPKSFRFRCPGCSKNLKMPSEIIGKKIRCPHCQSMLMAKRFS